MTLFRKAIDYTLMFLTVACFSGVIIAVTVQIISRFTPVSFIWTEELTRYLFLYSIAFGAPLGLLRNEFINVDVLLNRLPHTFRRYYEILIYAAIVLLSVIIMVEGYEFTLLGNNQSSATLPIQMSYIHASILIMGVFLIFYAIVKIIDLVKNKVEFKQTFGGEEL